MKYIQDSDWALYKEIIDGVHEDFNQDTITLMSKVRVRNRYQEDTNRESNYNHIPLKCLIQYNVFRTWPMTKETDSGSTDAESIVVLLNNTYLSSINMLTTEGNLDYDPGNDLFEFRGHIYRDAGNTPISQAKDNPLLTLIILKRLPKDTP